MSTSRTIRVFQVATGNLGTEMIGRIQNHPDLELVGLHCYTADKIGRDAGEIVGLPPLGVTATGTVEEIIAAKPDVLTFHGVFPDEDLYEKVLEAGINVVTTADWITGYHRDTNWQHPSGRKVSEVIEAACQRGGSTFYGTGMNPGLCQILGIVHSADVAEIENVTVTESVDVSCHHSVDTWKAVGYGLPVDDPSIPDSLYKYTAVFADSVYLMADAFGLELDEVKYSYELGACTKDVDLGWYFLPKGSLGANYIKYQGMVDGVPRVETHLEWQMTPHTDPAWDIKACYITQITGDPSIYSKHMIFPKADMDLSKPENFASIGMTVTGLPALNSIRSVVEARPGIITSNDLPLRAFCGELQDLSTRSTPAASYLCSTSTFTQVRSQVHTQEHDGRVPPNERPARRQRSYRHRQVVGVDWIHLGGCQPCHQPIVKSRPLDENPLQGAVRQSPVLSRTEVGLGDYAQRFTVRDRRQVDRIQHRKRHRFRPHPVGSVLLRDDSTASGARVERACPRDTVSTSGYLRKLSTQAGRRQACGDELVVVACHGDELFCDKS